MPALKVDWEVGEGSTFWWG